MMKLKKLALSIIGILPTKWAIADGVKASSTFEGKKVKGGLAIDSLSISSFHNLVLPDRSREISIEEAWINFDSHFPEASEVQKNLVFQRYLDHLIISKKIMLDSEFILRGNTSGIRTTE